MRVVMFPAGTRGDFEPLLAFAVALKAAGHEPHMVCNPNYCVQAAEFDVPTTPIGIDTQVVLQKLRLRASHSRTLYQFFKFGRTMATALVDDPKWRAQHADVDVVVGGTLVRSAATLAECLRVPYVHIVVTPQMLRSSAYPPLISPICGLPQAANRALWAGFAALNRGVFAGPINAKRAQLGLPPVDDILGHLYPRTSFLASDPELAPVPPDVELDHPAFGAFMLPARGGLGGALERFLAAGPPPVFIGFGSVVDPDPDATSQLFIEAAAEAGMRLVLSRGWSKFGDRAASDRVFVTDVVPFSSLFERVAAVVHHGGAGTTATAARAGVPQIIVPHWFDQFQWGQWCVEAGVAPKPFPRHQLTVRRLADALRASQAPAMRARAAALAHRLRHRDPLGAAVRALTEVVAAHRRTAGAAHAAVPGA